MVPRAGLEPARPHGHWILSFDMILEVEATCLDTRIGTAEYPDAC